MNWNKQTIILALNSVKRANTQKKTIALPVVVFLYYWNKTLERKTNKKNTKIKLAFLLIFPLALFSPPLGDDGFDYMLCSFLLISFYPFHFIAYRIVDTKHTDTILRHFYADSSLCWRNWGDFLVYFAIGDGYFWTISTIKSNEFFIHEPKRRPIPKYSLTFPLLAFRSKLFDFNTGIYRTLR